MWRQCSGNETNVWGSRRMLLRMCSMHKFQAGWRVLFLFVFLLWLLWWDVCVSVGWRSAPVCGPTEWSERRMGAGWRRGLARGLTGRTGVTEGVWRGECRAETTKNERRKTTGDKRRNGADSGCEEEKERPDVRVVISVQARSVSVYVLLCLLLWAK